LDEYPNYHIQGVVKLSSGQKEDKKYHNATHDFVFNIKNVNIMKAFLIEKKHKPNKLTPEGRPIQYSFTHLYKYYHTILFGVHRAKVALSEIFEMEIKGYLD
jgi:hypothetical protein